MPTLAKPAPQAIVIFGASGDLTARKLAPALYNLFEQDLLPDDFAIVGYSRSPMSDEEFQASIKKAIEANSRCKITPRWSEFARRLRYVPGDYFLQDCMHHLSVELKKVDEELGTAGGRLFYCATPPETFPEIGKRIGEAGLAEGSRIVVEKPFGSDGASAIELNRVLHEVFDEKQIFRIDHYLGKETVQNIMVFRFSNGMFEPIWDRRYISSVQIDVAEDLGIGSRGAFYEGAGAVRDIVQNHMMQLLAILAMEPPASFDAESIRDEKVKLLKAISPIDPGDVVRGQYQKGEIEGEQVLGYRQEPKVDPDSITETFIALKLYIENWRWARVPIFLRTGKRLPERTTTITVVFHDAPHLLFDQSGMQRPEPNHITIRVQPNEGIALTFDAKVPGPEMTVAPVEMEFSYDESFMTEPGEAYERLIHDVMHGDATLFTRADEIEHSWTIVEPLLHRTPPDFYPAGSWGPEKAEELVSPGCWYVR
ncbi:MAG TPA: glucose-6-phosphate dehydrogenase [Actinomycetota bacterium]|nr:glucose-6-phosphate dehydrogenase [Actinomycetota bacterium]